MQKIEFKDFGQDLMYMTIDDDGFITACEYGLWAKTLIGLEVDRENLQVGEQIYIYTKTAITAYKKLIVAKITPVFKVSDLQVGQKFKWQEAQRKWREVIYLHPDLKSGPPENIGATLIGYDDCRQLVLKPDVEVFVQQ
jgi:hypothetical protein